MAQLTDKVQSTSDATSKFRSSYPPTILKKETNYETGRQIANNELRCLNFLYLIDNDETCPANLVTEQKETQTWCDVTYLLTRLCGELKQHTSNVKTPNEIIAKLKDLKFPKFSPIKFDVKHRWLNLTYAKGKETAEKFVKRFEEKMRHTNRVTEVGDTEVVENLKCFQYSMKNFPEF